MNLNILLYFIWLLLKDIVVNSEVFVVDSGGELSFREYLSIWEYLLSIQEKELSIREYLLSIWERTCHFGINSCQFGSIYCHIGIGLVNSGAFVVNLGVLVDLGIFVVYSGGRVVENEISELLVKGTILTHFTFEVWNEIIELVVIYLLGVFIRGTPL
ncbi:hypothetical protein [Flavobacterium gillisiae]|uniref:hypothetical protein n=1 Tax=Flavobacterium gillisiae TaxID=150146 RepID=UPI000B838CE5|nr:hypothetical protein [Flavobacterium gillisiae]